MAGMEQVRTEDHPPAERFAFWLDTVVRGVLPVEVRTDHATDFRAEARMTAFGPVTVSWFSNPSLDVHRTRRLIQRCDPGAYHVGLVTRGRVEMSQDRRTATAAPGDLTLYDTSRPFRTRVIGSGDYPTGAGVMLTVPRDLLPLPAEKVSGLLAVRLPGRCGLGALVARYLTELATNASDYQPNDLARLAAVTLDLVAARLAHELDATGMLPTEAHQRVLLARVYAHIQRHLADPRLTPRSIADAHHMSLRSLHRLFSGEGTTVAAWIRAQRLERARRDLADPRLRIRTVRAIAARCGFTDVSHFGRAFRTAHGMGPQAYRRLHLDAAGSGPARIDIHHARN